VTRIRASLLFSSVCVLLLLAGCGGSDSGPAPDLGDWTLQEDGLALSKDLQVSETEAFYFGSVSDLDVTSDGHMVVADGQALNVKVVRPDGSLLDTLGGAGQGPGEIQDLRSVQVARSDSIYAFDIQLDRLTVFTPPPSSTLARSVVIGSKRGAPTQVRVLRDWLAGRVTPGYSRKEGLRRPPHMRLAACLVGDCGGPDTGPTVMGP